jgi:hypothetical protein
MTVLAVLYEFEVQPIEKSVRLVYNHNR